jgi:hypothetical protein
MTESTAERQAFFIEIDGKSSAYGDCHWGGGADKGQPEAAFRFN